MKRDEKAQERPGIFIYVDSSNIMTPDRFSEFNIAYSWQPTEETGFNEKEFIKKNSMPLDR